LLAKIADLLEDPGTALRSMPVPSAADDLRDLLERIDTSPATTQAPVTSQEGALLEGAPLEAPFLDRTSLARMLDELYEHFGAASFTVQFLDDRAGLLDAATRLLDDLRLIRRMPGGVLILPAAARYRNITAALPEGTRHDGQGMFDRGT
jgi:hypothetical protein